jgi:hypothetical protein
MELVNGGGCSFNDMMFYASAQLYHIGSLQSATWYSAGYHTVGIAYYTEKLVGCM